MDTDLTTAVTRVDAVCTMVAAAAPAPAKYGEVAIDGTDMAGRVVTLRKLVCQCLLF